MANAKKNNKKKGTSKTVRVLKMTAICILAIVLLAVMFFIVFFASNGFGGSVATFVCTINGKTILTSQSISLPSGSTVNVYSLSDYTISIIAAEDYDFAFTIDGGLYSWSEYAGEDMTEGFTFTETDDGIVITYGSLNDILTAVFDTVATISEDVEGEVFELVIESGDIVLYLPFEITATAGSVVLDPDSIIF